MVQESVKLLEDECAIYLAEFPFAAEFCIIVSIMGVKKSIGFLASSKLHGYCIPVVNSRILFASLSLFF